MQTIAVLGGDGIGPEITQAALTVMTALRPDLNYRERLVGAAALQRGMPSLPHETRELCDESASILFGSVGGLITTPSTEDRPERALLPFVATTSYSQIYGPSEYFLDWRTPRPSSQNSCVDSIYS